MILLLLLLVLIPIAAHAWAKKHAPLRRGVITGIGIGLVASPVSLGLYATYFLSPLGIVTGMVGLALVLWHASPGYYISTIIGLAAERTVVEGSSRVIVEVANGIFWGSVYGALGYGIDDLRLRRTAL